MLRAVASGIIVALGMTAAWAQDQPPAATTPQLATPQPAVTMIENTGKPMVLPFQCTAEDTQWAGLQCSDEEPCPIYLELTAVESAGDRILVAGNVHSTSVTLFSVLLSSDDAGHTWREAHEHI